MKDGTWILLLWPGSIITVTGLMVFFGSRARAESGIWRHIKRVALWEGRDNQRRHKWLSSGQ